VELYKYENFVFGPSNSHRLFHQARRETRKKIVPFRRGSHKKIPQPPLSLFLARVAALFRFGHFNEPNRSIFLPAKGNAFLQAAEI
jgi:hypothetical protein